MEASFHATRKNWRSPSSARGRRVDRLLSKDCGAIAGRGEATTWYDRHTGTWQRVFVNDYGHSLKLSGRVEAGRLVLTGRNAFFDGRMGLHRMTWTPEPGGVIRQRWEFSTDEGRSWETILASRAMPQR